MKIVEMLSNGLNNVDDPFAGIQRMQLTGIIKRAADCEIGLTEATKDVQVALMSQVSAKGNIELKQEEERLFQEKLKSYQIELKLYNDELLAYNLTAKLLPPPIAPIRPVR